MTRAYQLPVATELATRTGPRLWRKTVLRAGHISKGGVELDVDRALLDALAANFAAGAKDQVPFVLADARNRHNELPERVRGEILDLRVTDDDRLEATFGVTTRGDQLLADNPRLGASVSFVDRFSRADGRDHGPTLLHVAGTLDPEIAGLGDWVRADLAAVAPEVFDLSGATTTELPAAPDGADLPATTGGPSTTEEAEPMAQLTDDELARLRALLDRATTPDTDQPDGEPSPDLTDDELHAVADAVLDEEPADDPDTADVPELIAASAGESEALNLANARLDAQQVELAALRAERDGERYEKERAELAREFGIPPRITDLCRRWLTGSRTVELAHGVTADPGADIRNLLREIGAVTKLLDLSTARGSANDAADTTEATERADFIDHARASGFAQ